MEAMENFQPNELQPADSADKGDGGDPLGAETRQEESVGVGKNGPSLDENALKNEILSAKNTFHKMDKLLEKYGIESLANVFVKIASHEENDGCIKGIVGSTFIGLLFPILCKMCHLGHSDEAAKFLSKLFDGQADGITLLDSGDCDALIQMLASKNMDRAKGLALADSVVNDKLPFSDQKKAFLEKLEKNCPKITGPKKNKIRNNLPAKAAKNDILLERRKSKAMEVYPETPIASGIARKKSILFFGSSSLKASCLAWEFWHSRLPLLSASTPAVPAAKKNMHSSIKWAKNMDAVG
ncbi:MAG: hypothetical protein LBI69_04755 [Puniceicoccales bacterium]|jgi:hypothetical protein|nr:hypothetical protein [Puniceicoccales bacterium]